MSRQLADHLKSYGRGDDTELVHMTKGEIKGLQELALAHGGSLSINPDTGLVEAGFLKNILPAVAGIALTGLSGGMINPLTAGMIVGGFEGIRTGDIGKGLTAGLGAYGGAGLGSAAGIGASAAPTATTTATTGLSTAGGAGSQAAGLSSGNLGAASSNLGSLTPTATGGAAGITAPANSLYAPNLTASAPSMAGSQIAKYGMAAATPALADAATVKPIGGMPTEKSSGEYISKDFRAYVPNRPDPYYRPLGLGYAEGGEVDQKKSGLGNALSALSAPQKGSDGETSNQAQGMMGGMLRGLFAKLKDKNQPAMLSPNFRAYIAEQPQEYYVPTGLGYESYAAGGMVDPMQRMPNGGLASIQGVRDGYGAPQTVDGNIPQFAEGGQLQMKRMRLGDGIFKDTNPNTANLGADEAAEYYVRNAAKKNKVPYTKMPKTNIENLGEINVGVAKAAGGSIGGYSDGGRMLKGPGDGMSDSIPGVIGSKQPARLADGEFVVPADVVSHLGNGSTDAGAKRLYAMMDKVRKARTGTKKQGKQIKPEKYMPA